MSAFFIFLLFVLNIFTIFAIIVLYLRQNRLSMLEKDQKAVIGEMEQLLSGYLMEMKEDNETLVKAINNSVAMNPEHGQKDKNIVQSKKQRKKNKNKTFCRAAAKRQAINAYKIMPEKMRPMLYP